MAPRGIVEYTLYYDSEAQHLLILAAQLPHAQASVQLIHISALCVTNHPGDSAVTGRGAPRFALFRASRPLTPIQERVASAGCPVSHSQCFIEAAAHFKPFWSTPPAGHSVWQQGPLRPQ